MVKQQLNRMQFEQQPSSQLGQIGADLIAPFHHLQPLMTKHTVMNKENIDYINMPHISSTTNQRHSKDIGNQGPAQPPVLKGQNGLGSTSNQQQNGTPGFTNIFKSYKQMQGCSTSTSINLPRGTNQPKRSFGRDLPVTST